MNIFLLFLVLPLAAGDPALPASPDSLFIRGSGSSFDVDLYGRVGLVDAQVSTVTLFSVDGTPPRSTGGTGWGNDQFDSPAAVWMRNGIDIFVADLNNHRIQRFDRNLNYVSTLNTRNNADPDERFGYPSDVAVSRLGDLYVCDTENARVLKFDLSYRVERAFGGIAAGKGRLHRPTELEIGPSDRVYVLDGTRVQVFDSFGNFVGTIADSLLADRVTMSADQDGLAVMNGSSVLLFDAYDRPAGTLSLSDSSSSGIPYGKAVVVRGDDLYVLVPGGVVRVRGARANALTK